MFSNKSFGEQNDATKSMHVDPVDASSLRYKNVRKSLLERLKPDTPCQAKQQPDVAPREPQYVDVTAAFFGRQRRRALQVKNSAPSHPAHQHQQPPPEPRQQRSSPLVLPLQQQKRQNPLDGPRTPDAPLANELRSELDQNIAAEGSHIYSHGAARLNDQYEALKVAVADTSVKNGRVLAQAKFQNKSIIKPLSEMSLKETLIDKDGKTTLRQVHVGKEIESIYEKIQALEVEVGQLWDDWEAAEHQVQVILASIAGSGGSLSVDQALSINDVQDSLAREMEKYDEELERILMESHEAVRASEKEFTRKIIGVMDSLLQQYLLGD
ncbi:hypothetical protein VMCG_06513 [Cytospora schulzeri]|uniref:Uncharacterized protein n=1 Tax=Cytospora schulzeri TaxID=448051 RepID=A0A423WBS9_9PEZI|nr:hypothetical protein VMCG_06513 [Valsa malicola]